MIIHLPRRDFITIALSLGIVVSLAWWYLLSLASGMPVDMATAMQTTPAWDFSYFSQMFLMWAIMMVAMMLPSVAPTVMVYSLVAQKAARENRPVSPTSMFIGGYLLIWVGFSALATYAQCLLDESGLLSPMMSVENNFVAGSFFILAGGWQFTPLKESCLEQCRSPVEFIAKNWRKGPYGAILLGIRHGVYCLGCCWAIMALLFVGGVMNLLWIALLSIFVLLEKILPFGKYSYLVSGSALIATGVSFLFIV